jgi:hypothetical protein
MSNAILGNYNQKNIIYDLEEIKLPKLRLLYLDNNNIESIERLQFMSFPLLNRL